MAPDLTQTQYKKRLASYRQGLESGSPVDDSLAPFAPQPVIPDGSKKAKPSRSKLRRNTSSKSRSSTFPLAAHNMSDLDDKKRNKLGYQRISIACAHCRRRKIRCLVAEGDPQNRCQNCIRLKKECLFYPVDQQSAMDPPPNGNSKHGHGSTRTPSVTMSPSQDPINGTLENGYRPYADMPGIPISPGGPFAHNDYSLPQGPPTPWSPQGDCSPHSQTLPTTQSYPAYSNMVVNPAYVPFPGTSLDPNHPDVPRGATMGYGQDGDRSAWSQPQPSRSMSYDAMYNSRYPAEPQQLAGAYTQAPMQMSPHSAPIPVYGQPMNYALVHDPNGGGVPGMSMHSAPSASWTSPGLMLPTREEKSRSLVGSQ